MKILRIGLCIILFSQTIACSAFNASTQTVKFTCEPKDGVTLVVSGKKYPCPVTLELPRNQEFTIEGYKDEYLPYRRTVSYHNNETFTLDLIGGCLLAFPFIGLFTPGAKDIDETDIMVILQTK